MTSVSWDDITDGGAAHFVRTMEIIRKECPKMQIEVLSPDFNGSKSVLGLGFTGVAAGPHVRSSFKAGELSKGSERNNLRHRYEKVLFVVTNADVF